tara:strand:- start:430 stop:840 length:411 start_codon:yes stop_codon:yes gene_type:complete
MKISILIIVVLLPIGCSKDSEPVRDTFKETQKKLTPEEKFAGTYEIRKVGDIYRYVFTSNGVVKGFRLNLNSNVWEQDYISKWKIVGRDLHIVDEDGSTAISVINPDGSFSDIAYIVDGKRDDVPVGMRPTYNRIK